MSSSFHARFRFFNCFSWPRLGSFPHTSHNRPTCAHTSVCQDANSRVFRHGVWFRINGFPLPRLCEKSSSDRAVGQVASERGHFWDAVPAPGRFSTESGARSLCGGSPGSFHTVSSAGMTMGMTERFREQWIPVSERMIWRLISRYCRPHALLTHVERSGFGVVCPSSASPISSLFLSASAGRARWVCANDVFPHPAKIDRTS